MTDLISILPSIAGYHHQTYKLLLLLTKVRFSKSTTSDFYSTLNKNVEDYFIHNKLSKKGNGVMAFKVVFYPAVLIATYLLLILSNAALPVQFVLWIIIGFFTALVGLNISHDAVHGSLSANKSVNKVLGYTFNI